MPQAVSGDQKSFTHRGSAGLRWALVLLPLFMVLGTWAWPSQHTHSCTQILPVLAPTWIDYTSCEHSITTSSHPSSGHPTPLREVRSSVNIRKKSRVAEEYHVNYSKSTMLVTKRCLFSSWNFLPLNQTVTNSGLKWFLFFSQNSLLYSLVHTKFKSPLIYFRPGQIGFTLNPLSDPDRMLLAGVR